MGRSFIHSPRGPPFARRISCRTKPVPSCFGSGRGRCSGCLGGKVSCTSCSGGRRWVNTPVWGNGYYESCSSCGGSGYRNCLSCGGSGSISCGSCGGSGGRHVASPASPWPATNVSPTYGSTPSSPSVGGRSMRSQSVAGAYTPAPPAGRDHHRRRLPGVFRPGWWIDHGPLVMFETIGDKLAGFGWKMKLAASLAGALTLLSMTSGQPAAWPWGQSLATEVAGGNALWIVAGCGVLLGWILFPVLSRAIFLLVRVSALLIAWAFGLATIAAIASIIYAVARFVAGHSS
jgi:hypothetical protein